MDTEKAALTSITAHVRIRPPSSGSLKVLASAALVDDDRRKCVPLISTSLVERTQFFSVKANTRAELAGFSFYVDRVHHMLLRGNCAQCVSDKSPVCLDAVLEYLVADLVDVASGVAVDNEIGCMFPRHMHLVICEDKELNNLAANMATPPHGVKTVGGGAAGHENR
ncbi:unnamed protein product [Hydatigera taeniaeformis]|uniref:Histone H2A n=1 Tax=Hydatigena taeniaeformis TaxID=6205 RepID=A0A0R3X7K8_HYDTA|nr:unnamed protein product [Hydatigera taeniaeformis]